MAVCVVLTAVATRAQAGRLSKGLVREKLAACVTGLPGAVSHYRWKGRRQTASEVLLLIKTSRRLWPRLERFLKKNHPYELPEILLVPVQKSSKEYLSWVNASLTS